MNAREYIPIPDYSFDCHTRATPSPFRKSSVSEKALIARHAQAGRPRIGG